MGQQFHLALTDRNLCFRILRFVSIEKRRLQMQQVDGALDHVLVVDDDPILRAIAESHFKKRGAREIESAGDGIEALQILDGGGNPPSFLLCDLNMPNMDGIKFLRHLEQRHFGGAVAIVSGEHDTVISLAESVAKAHNLNIVGTLQKPLRADALDQLIDSASSAMAAPTQTSPNVIGPADLRAAITQGDIISYYQPKVDTKSGHIVGAEALARWQHPELGLISPGHFIPLAEQSNLIGDLTERILDTALDDARYWPAGHAKSISCAINISVDALNDIDLPDRIAQRVANAGLQSSQIVIEVTESSILKREATPMEVLARLRLKGFDLSIDDFGTGYSNIEQLRYFPFSELKIDQSFVSEMETDAFALESVRASIELGKKLGLRLVAEGVETKSVYDLVAGRGVDQVQGYLFGKPMPQDQFVRWLKGYRTP